MSLLFTLATLSALPAEAAPRASDYAVPAGRVTAPPRSARHPGTGLGPADAVVRILDFSDFQCPHCASSWRLLSQYAAEHPDVSVAIRHYPLSAECNPQVDSANHTRACGAARAAFCAADQGKLPELARLFFLNPAFLAPDDITFMAGQVGLDADRLGACMDAPRTAARLRRDVKAGVVAGIQGTPTLYVWGPWGDRWVLTNGPEAAFAAIAALRAGQALPEPTPAEPAIR